MSRKIDVLDQGFVRLVDAMPNLPGAADTAIVEAARVSYQQGTAASRNERGLIRYLMRNWHTSPFEMVELKFHLKMPIFVARQWMRHRTASINEVSARYSVLPDEAYAPKSNDIGVQSKTNKQGREEGLSAADSAHVKDLISHQSAEAFSAYGELLSKGVAREQARLVLPVNTYTEFYWKANLLNTMRLLQLRMDPHAQKECQVYAEAIYEMAKEIAPVTMEAFSDYWLEGAKFSAQEWTLLKKTLSYSQIEAVLSGAVSVLSPGEIAELRKKLT